MESRNNVIGLLLGLIICISVSFGFIHKKQNDLIDMQEGKIGRYANIIDSVTVEYIRYRIDNEKPK